MRYENMIKTMKLECKSALQNIYSCWTEYINYWHHGKPIIFFFDLLYKIKNKKLLVSIPLKPEA